MFKNIVALALNPSLDTTIWLDQIRMGEENIATAERFDASGKAVNIARTLKYYGVENELVLLLGKHNMIPYISQLDREKIKYHLVTVEGHTRENLTIIQRDGNSTRIMRKGFVVEHEAVEEVLAMLEQCVGEGTLVMISGQLPDGVSVRRFKMICAKIKELGGVISLDSRSLTLEDMLEIGPWLIKPNRREFLQLVGRPLETRQELAAAAAEVVKQGIRHCLVSLGADGLVYAGPEGVFAAYVPQVIVKSATSAGDSLLSGFIKAKLSGKDIRRCLQTAAAFGTAACMIEGSVPPPKLSLGNILEQVQVEEINLD